MIQITACWEAWDKQLQKKSAGVRRAGSEIELGMVSWGGGVG